MRTFIIAAAAALSAAPAQAATTFNLGANPAVNSTGVTLNNGTTSLSLAGRLYTNGQDRKSVV